MDDKSYQDGLREGRIRGIEETIRRHGEKHEQLERRMTAQERISFGILGAMVLVNVLPALKGMLT